MDLSIIIINWNSVNFLQKCLQSIISNTFDIKYEIIVLDNASYDGCDEILSLEYPDVIFLQGKLNRGFAAANNFAVKFAKGKKLLFLNPDTEIFPSAINRLYNAFDLVAKPGSIGARLLNSDQTFQNSCIQPFPNIINKIFDSDLSRKFFPESKIWGIPKLADKSDKPLSVDGISGACLMTEKKNFLKVNGFNEYYFMYYEDMDYCRKMKESGLINYYIPTATVIHHGGKSSGGSYSKFAVITMSDSGYKYFRIWKGKKYSDLYRFLVGIKSFICIILLSILYPFIRTEMVFKNRKFSLNKWLHNLKWSISNKPFITQQ